MECTKRGAYTAETADLIIEQSWKADWSRITTYLLVIMLRIAADRPMTYSAVSLLHL